MLLRYLKSYICNSVAELRIIRFDPKVNLKDLEIKQFNPEHPLNELNRLNKLKKSNPEAFHYWYQIYKIIQENK